MRRVAVIGAGSAGIVAARYLKSEGVEPVVFEQRGRIGGQWSGEQGQSGVWPLMRNTSRVITAFSDLPHSAGTSTYGSPRSRRSRGYRQRHEAVRPERGGQPGAVWSGVGECFGDYASMEDDSKSRCL